MTQLLDVAGLWKGETVAVIGTADPDLDAAREFTSIAVNRAVSLAPWADMVVSLDANLPADAADYAGMRVYGAQSDADAWVVPLRYEVVDLGREGVLHIRHNALTAIRIASEAGAARVLLTGINAESYEATYGVRGFVEGLAQLRRELSERGVEVADLR